MEPKLRDAAEPLPPVAVPTVTASPKDGPFAGRTIVFQVPSTRYWVESKRAGYSNSDFYAEIVGSIVSHDLGRDPWDLPPAMVAELGTIWVQAIREKALPPTTGSS